MVQAVSPPKFMGSPTRRHGKLPQEMGDTRLAPRDGRRKNSFCDDKTSFYVSHLWGQEAAYLRPRLRDRVCPQRWEM